MSLHLSSKWDWETTDNYMHAGWNTRQVITVVGSLIAAALAALCISELKKQYGNNHGRIERKYEPWYVDPGQGTK